MIRIKRNSITVFVILLVLSAIFITVLVFGIRESNKARKLYEELVAKYGKNQSIFYTENEKIYIGNKIIDCAKISEYAVHPLYVTKDAVYFSDRNSVDGVRHYYKADHTFDSIQLIHSHKDDRTMTAYMPSDNEICYIDEDGKSYVYFIDEKIVEPYNGESIWDYLTENDLYSIEKQSKGVFTTQNTFTITHKTTGEQVVLSASTEKLFKTDILSDIANDFEICLHAVWCEDDRIYVQCDILNVVITFEYLIETDSFLYLDIAYIVDIEAYQTFLD